MNSESFSWMKSKKLSQWREKKRRKNEEKNEETHQITFLSVRLGTEKETMKKKWDQTYVTDSQEMLEYYVKMYSYKYQSCKFPQIFM